MNPVKKEETKGDMLGVEHVFTKAVLHIDQEKEVAKISKRLRDLMVSRLKRRGVIIGLSGGIDSSVTTALAEKALARPGF